MTETNQTPPQSRRGIMLLAGIGLLAGLLMAAALLLANQPRTGSGSAASSAFDDPVQVGQPAPDFTGVTPDGQTISLASLRGRPVAINFWATWCGPCIVEMPALQAAEAAHADVDLMILGVNAGESAEQVGPFLEELGITFTNVLDEDTAIVDAYLVRVFPTTIWVDAEGIVRAEHLGPLDEDLIERYAELVGTAN